MPTKLFALQKNEFIQQLCWIDFRSENIKVCRISELFPHKNKELLGEKYYFQTNLDHVRLMKGTPRSYNG